MMLQLLISLFIWYICAVIVFLALIIMDEPQPDRMFGCDTPNWGRAVKAILWPLLFVVYIFKFLRR